jgi:DNA-binding MarR family transcriptional regulator
MVDAVALDRFPPLRLALLANRLTRMMGRACRPLGLSAPGWRVIVLLGQTDSLPLRELLARSGIDKARLSRVTTRLCGQGYIEPQATAGDRRRLSLELTPRGRKLHRELMQLLTNVQAMLLRDIGSEEYQVFERVLDSLESQSKAAESAAPDRIEPAAADRDA